MLGFNESLILCHFFNVFHYTVVERIEIIGNINKMGGCWNRTAQKMTFFTMDFFSKYDQVCGGAYWGST